MRQIHLHSQDAGRRRLIRRRLAAAVFVVVAVSFVFFWWGTRFSPAPSTGESAEPATLERHPEAIFSGGPVLAPRSNTPEAAERGDEIALTPKPMRLVRKVLLEKSWNSGPDALGLTVPRSADGAIRDGSFVRPNAVALAGDSIYVLDSSGNRLAVYDQGGRKPRLRWPPATALSPDGVGKPINVSAITHLSDGGANLFQAQSVYAD